MAQWSRADIALAEDEILIPTTIPVSSQPPVPSAPRAAHASGFPNTCVHTCADQQRQMTKNEIICKTPLLVHCPPHLFGGTVSVFPVLSPSRAPYSLLWPRQPTQNCWGIPY